MNTIKIWTAERIAIKYNSDAVDMRDEGFDKVANKKFVELDDLKEKMSELRFGADIAGLNLDVEIILQELEKSFGLRAFVR